MFHKLFIPAILLFAFVSCEKESTTEILEDNNNSNHSYGTLTDSRDGKIYKTVTLGNQTWFAENFAYKADSGCLVYNNNKSNVEEYGYLYNLEAAIAFAPEGWHVPTLTEWDTLRVYLRDNGFECFDEVGVTAIAKAMANPEKWLTSDVEGAIGNNDYPDFQNKSGFSALPSGYAAISADSIEFKSLGEETFFMASDFITEDLIRIKGLSYESESLTSWLFYYKNFCSVRYVKD